jgi:COP9 signalosome complex subunit 5
MDQLYSYPEDAIATVRKQKLWCNDAKYFKKVKISPSATIKMLSHGQQGVDKGTAKSGKPIEVMGLLLGRPDNIDPTSLVISDALPLPIEGFETRVVADDENVINYMIELGESMELTRKEKFCGWYHTHPFDLDGTSHCFLSNTDITTQLQWQRMEDPHGNPWLAIVIDPLLSIAKERPEMMAFRVYPPEYSPPANETPDGKLIKDDRVRVEKWGACWNRYYTIPIEYFMSNLSKDSLNKLSNKFLWEKPLTSAVSSSAAPEILQEEINTLNMMSSSLNRLKFNKRSSHSGGGGGGGSGSHHMGAEEDTPFMSSSAVEGIDYPSASSSSITGAGGGGGSNERDNKGLKAATITARDIAMNHLCSICTQLVKLQVFCNSCDKSPSSSASSKVVTGGSGGENKDLMEVTP